MSNHIPDPGPLPAPTGTLSVNMNGKTYREDQATDMGVYNGQVCKMVRDGNWTIWFRREVDGFFPEVIFDYGIAKPNADASHSGPYTAEIYDAGGLAHKEKIDEHFWSTRWRHQLQGAKPFQHTIEEAVTSGLFPNLKLGRGHRDLPGGADDYEPMGTSSLQPFMGATGERPDIGIHTGWAAKAILTGKLDDLLNIAEAASSIPGCLRLEDGSILDVTRPNQLFPPALNMDLTFHGNARGKPHFIPRSDEPVNRDTAHHPSTSALAYYLTGDTYHLENLHIACMNHVTWSSWGHAHNAAGLDNLLIDNSQHRAMAWVLRDMFHAYELTEEQSAPWLLPRSFFRKSIDDYAKELKALLIDNPEPLTKHFGFLVGGKADDPGGRPWETHFIGAVLGVMLYHDAESYAAYKPLFEKILEGAVALTNGTSGFDRRFCAIYHLSEEDFNNVTTWTDLSDTLIDVYGYNASFAHPDQTSELDYMSFANYIWGVLKMAEKLDYDVADSVTWMQKAKDYYGRRQYAKWSFA